MIVAADLYATEKFADELRELLGPQFNVTCVYRDYHAEEFAPDVDMILSNGLCKTARGEGSYWIRYSGADLAKRHGKRHIPFGLGKYYFSASFVSRRIRKRIEETTLTK